MIETFFEEFRIFIWNIGGALFTASIILLGIVGIWSFIINRLSGWHKPEWRENLFYWIKNKQKINKIIEDMKRDKL